MICDQCASDEYPIRFVDDEYGSSVCQRCWDHEEAAIEAGALALAALAMHSIEGIGDKPKPGPNTLAWARAVIDAYHRHHNDLAVADGGEAGS